MPELTVSMPAYNTGKYIGQTIQTVLRQTGVDFELIIVDDGSQDDTQTIARSFEDPRVKLLINPANRGISHCHNRVIRASDSRFIAHVDSDDLVLPGAFRRIMTELKSDPRIGQVHCYFFEVDEDGKVTREAFRARRRTQLRDRPPNMDYKRELLVRGTVTNHLRTYRREVFEELGCFNERLRYSEDYEMALRIIDRYTIKLVPEFLYGYRRHESNTTNRLDFSSLGFFFQRVRICRELSKNNQVSFLKNGKYNLNRLLLEGLYEIMKRAELRNFLPEFLKMIRGFSSVDIFMRLRNYGLTKSSPS
jgi:glycosyltransferase involved in cell wall biosynthesis